MNTIDVVICNEFILFCSNLDNLPRNPYFVCRAFWNEEPVTSVVCWGSSTPRFNFQQVEYVLSYVEYFIRHFVIYL